MIVYDFGDPVGKFKIGDRIRLTEYGRWVLLSPAGLRYRKMTAETLATVVGRGRRRACVRIKIDGYANPDTYAESFWELALPTEFPAPEVP